MRAIINLGYFPYSSHSDKHFLTNKRQPFSLPPPRLRSFTFLAVHLVFEKMAQSYITAAAWLVIEMIIQPHFLFTCHIQHHELWTPNEAFFHWKPEVLGLGRKIGQINSRAFGVFSAELSAPILPFWYSESLVHVFHYSTIISSRN